MNSNLIAESNDSVSVDAWIRGMLKSLAWELRARYGDSLTTPHVVEVTTSKGRFLCMISPSAEKPWMEAAAKAKR